MKIPALWLGWCPFRRELEKSFDLVVASSAMDRDIPLAPLQSHVRWRQLAARAGMSPRLIICGAYDTAFPMDLDEAEVPTVCVAPEPSPAASATVECFDHLLSTARYMVTDGFSNIAGMRAWLPLWADVDAPPPNSPRPLADRTIDVAFVGHLGGADRQPRTDFLRRVSSLLGREVRFHLGEGSWPDIYSDSRVVLNAPTLADLPAGEMNPRVLEATACGALLLTSASPQGIGDLFALGHEVMVYRQGDPEDAAAGIRQALSDIPRAQAMATRARLKTHSQHLRPHRGSELRSLLEQLVDQPTVKLPLRERRIRLARSFITGVAYSERVFDTFWNMTIVLPLREARRLLSESLREAPSSSHAAFLVALVDILEGHPEQAIEWLFQAAADPSVESLARFALSRLFRRLKDGSRARLYYPQGLRPDSLSPDGRRTLDLLYRVLNFDFSLSLAHIRTPGDEVSGVAVQRIHKSRKADRTFSLA